MTPNRKAASPVQAGTSGKAALTQQNNRKNNTIVKPDSQPEKLLAALRVASVTTPAAIYDMKIPHPAGAVHRLRLQGHDVQTVLRPAAFPDGEIRWAAEYLLVDGMGGSTDAHV